ncbi:hypothetical protein HDU93_003876, partial [Gonapodya sp. JEL0774]
MALPGAFTATIWESCAPALADAVPSREAVRDAVTLTVPSDNVAVMLAEIEELGVGAVEGRMESEGVPTAVPGAAFPSTVVDMVSTGIILLDVIAEVATPVNMLAPCSVAGGTEGVIPGTVADGIMSPVSVAAADAADVDGIVPGLVAGGI